MMKPRISISDEAMCWVVSTLEEQASEQLDAEVVRQPWVVLMLERSKKDDENDRYPIICRDGTAPIVVSCIRAAARAADDGDWEIKRELQRVASKLKKDYAVEDVPTMRQALAVLSKQGYLRQATHEGGQLLAELLTARSQSRRRIPRSIVILGTAFAVTFLIGSCSYVTAVLLD